MKKQLCLLVAFVVSLSAQGESPYRMVQGKVVQIGRDWTVFREGIEVIGFNGSGLLCRTFSDHGVAGGLAVLPGSRGPHPQTVQTSHMSRVYGETFVLNNYPSAGGLRKGDVLRTPIAVMRVGSVAASPGSSRMYDLYDRGVEYTPPQRPLTLEEASAAKLKALKASTSQEAAKLKFEEEQAENGKDLYQYRLGMRYLNGDGVEKDVNKATEYLGKSAAQGNQDAAKALAKFAAQKAKPPAN